MIFERVRALGADIVADVEPALPFTMHAHGDGESENDNPLLARANHDTPLGYRHMPYTYRLRYQRFLFWACKVDILHVQNRKSTFHFLGYTTSSP